MLCSVTAIAPDGRRSTLEIDEPTVNKAIFSYNYRAVGNSAGLVVPVRGTVFEVEAGGKVYRTTWDRVLNWASREAEKNASKWKK